MKRTRASTYLVIAWHALVAGAILVVPGLVSLSAWVWELSLLNKILVVGLAAAYCAGAVLLTMRARLDSWSVEALAFGVTAAIATGAFALVLMRGTADYSRLILVGASALVFVGLVVPALVARGVGVRTAAVGLAIVAVAGYVGWQQQAPDAAMRGVRTETISASGHTLIATYFSESIPEGPGPNASGGGITAIPGDDAAYLLVTADGRLYRLTFLSDQELDVKSLGTRVPVNLAEFVSDIGITVPTYGFRVADVALRTDDTGTTIYASHHHWNREQRCYVVRVSALTVSSLGDMSGGEHGEWRSIFESAPCLPVAAARGSIFAGEQIGGNLELLGGELLLTMGDHQFDGWYHPENYVQDESAHYGKTLRIDLATNTVRVMTIGHRNPQGLVVHSSGLIWGTEHGPQGGDELNLLVDGGNYGYPYHTYGTEYGSVEWPPSDEAAFAKVNAHLPTFAWVPSIGVSDLIEIDDPAFARWRGDLLVSSLAGRTLWRVRFRPDAPIVAYVERIDVGVRVRDVAAAGRGDVLLLTDDYSLVRLTSAEALDAGAAIFAVRCGGCHDDIAHRIGPHLNGLFGRGIGKAQGYEFSAALSSIGGKWTDEKLEQFLASPSTFAPGTRMVVPLEDEAARRRIIEYLRSRD